MTRIFLPADPPGWQNPDSLNSGKLTAEAQRPLSFRKGPTQGIHPPANQLPRAQLVGVGARQLVGGWIFKPTTLETYFHHSRNQLQYREIN